jgi:ArsR family transcriptional regulator
MNKYSYVALEQTMELNEIVAAQLAELFSTLGDTSRIRIIAILAESEMNVGELAEQVGLTHSAVSHQLRHLRQMRLVRPRKDGRHVYYQLDDEHINDLFHCGLEHVLHG